MTEGNKILAALEAFQKGTGNYPQQLDELVPKYLPSIWTPTWGTRKWTYDPPDPKIEPTDAKYQFMLGVECDQDNMINFGYYDGIWRDMDAF